MRPIPASVIHYTSRDGCNIYAVMKRMCPFGHHQNGFVPTHALGHMIQPHIICPIYIYMYILYTFFSIGLVFLSFCHILLKICKFLNFISLSFLSRIRFHPALGVGQLPKFLLFQPNVTTLLKLFHRKNKKVYNDKYKPNTQANGSVLKGEQICFLNPLNSFMTEIPI